MQDQSLMGLAEHAEGSVEEHARNRWAYAPLLGTSRNPNWLAIGLLLFSRCSHFPSYLSVGMSLSVLSVTDVVFLIISFIFQYPLVPAFTFSLFYSKSSDIFLPDSFS